MSKIEDYWKASQDNFIWRDFAELQKAGLSAEILASLVADKAIGSDSVAVSGGRWRRRFNSQRAVILPIYGPASGELIDLIAFSPSTPRAFWVLTGKAGLLGYEAATRAEHFQEPLFLHETPLDWLKSGGEGSVILNWKHYWPLYFGRVREIRVGSEAFGERVHGLMSRPFPVPEVMVAT